MTSQTSRMRWQSSHVVKYARPPNFTIDSAKKTPRNDGSSQRISIPFAEPMRICMAEMRRPGESSDVATASIKYAEMKALPSVRMCFDSVPARHILSGMMWISSRSKTMVARVSENAKRKRSIHFGKAMLQSKCIGMCQSLTSCTSM